MKITLFDIDSIGSDLDLTPITSAGECTVYPYTKQDDMVSRIGDTEVAVINKIKMTRQVIDAAPHLKLICVSATGYDNIDTEYCRRRGIAVANVPAYSTDSVALVTVTTALSLVTHMREYTDFVRCGDYTKSGAPNRLSPVFRDLAGKTWGVIGYGNIGRQVAKVASAFGCRVIYTRSANDNSESCVTVDELCRESDIITVHCPLTDATRGMIDRRRIGLMKKAAVLVNAARGAVMDEAAVADAVESGDIAAFGCDVYSVEPFGEDHPYQRIKDLPNVCLTPHMAWASFEARTRVISEMAENIRAFEKGQVRCRVDSL